MKVTFLMPPILCGDKYPERVFGCNYGLYPVPNIFVLYSAAVLEQDNHEVSYIDFGFDNKNERDFVKFLESDKSDIYFIYTVQLAKEIDKKAVDIIRRIRAKVPIVFFGPAPSDKPEEFLVNRENVFVARGEPEFTIKDLVKSLADGKDFDGIEGVSYIKNGNIQHNPSRDLIKDLDILPFPARHLVDKKRYYNPKLGERPFTAVLTSRGCPYGCHYCVPCSINFAAELEHRRVNNKKPPVRLRSVDNIIAEFRHIKDKGYRTVSILDDQFPWGEDRTVQICNGIRDVGINWGCLARADHLTEPIVRAMAEAGCKYIDIGVESFTQKILDDIGKGLKVETIFKAIKLVKKYGIKVKLNVLLGSSPLETRETILYNLEQAKKVDADAVMFGICNPFPGTEFYHMARKENWFAYGDYYPVDVQKKALLNLPHLKCQELEELVRKCNRSFFLRPSFFIKHLKHIRNPRMVVESLSALVKKLKD